MLGWFISAYSTGVSTTSEPPTGSPNDAIPLARWTAGVSGLDWMDRVCRDGGGSFLGGDGYPFRYVFRAGVIKPLLLENPTRLHRTEFIDSPVPLSGGEGLRNVEEIICIPDDHWVLVVIFDRS